MHEARLSGGARWVMVPCEPDMISLIAAEVMLLNMGYLMCVASTTLPRQSGTTKVLYMFHKDLSGLLCI